MQPAANIIAYYMANGEIVFGQQKIEPDFKFNNYVSKKTIFYAL